MIGQKYLKSGLSGGVVSLYSNRTIQQVAVGLLGLFLPVFLFEKYNYSINHVLAFYLVSYLILLFLVAPGAMIASKISFKNSLILSVFGGVLYYVSFFFFDVNIFWFSVLALIGVNWDRILYWIPYHTDFTKFTDKKSRGSTIALLSSVAALIGIAVPVIAGFIIGSYGYSVLFLIVIFIYASSLIPFLALPKISEQYTFGYWQTWKFLFHKRDRRILFTYMADGAENMIASLIWPIFLFQVLDGSFEAVGIISSIIVLVTVIIRLLVGKYTDKFDKKKMIKYGSLLYSVGWIMKFFVATPFHVFVVSTYHNFSSIAMKTPYNALMYDKAADTGHYVDEYTVLREMSLALGRILALLLLMVLFSFLGMHYAFVIAAVVILFVNLI